jgi:hypothetical protein
MTTLRPFTWMASVGVLLCRCRPSTILWRVGTVVIDAINGMARRRSLTHVGVERFEALCPSRTHRNTAPTVVGESAIARVETPLFDRTPDGMFWRSSFAVSGHEFTMKTSATRRIAGSQSRDAYRLDASAITLASPCARSSSVSAEAQNEQTSIPMVGEVQRIRHRCNYIRDAGVCDAR